MEITEIKDFMDTNLKKVGEKLIQSYVKVIYPNAVCNECGDECKVTRVLIPTKTIVKGGCDFDVYVEFEELDGSPCCECEVTLYNDLGEEHPNPYWHLNLDLDNDDHGN